MMPNQINNHYEDVHPVSPLIINSLSKITGDLVLSSDVRVDGSVEGNITTTKSVIIGEDGHLKGNIKCNSLAVYGRIEGIAEVEGNTHLHASAVYVGRLNTGLISITKGCAINARINMDIPEADFIPATSSVKEITAIPIPAIVEVKTEAEVKTEILVEPKEAITIEPRRTIEVKKSIEQKEPKEVISEFKEIAEASTNNIPKKNKPITSEQFVTPKPTVTAINEPIITPRPQPQTATINEPFVVSKAQPQFSAPAPAQINAPVASPVASTTNSSGSSFLLSKLKGF